MADKVDPATRSRIMARVRSKDTAPELRLRRALWAAGVRGWRCHVRAVPGTPDLCWRHLRVAVFVDSAWWHGHSSRWTPGKVPAKWDAKIAANVERDVAVNAALTSAGWAVVRVWDFELEADIDDAVERVRDVLRLARAEGARRSEPPSVSSAVG